MRITRQEVSTAGSPGSDTKGPAGHPAGGGWRPVGHRARHAGLRRAGLRHRLAAAALTVVAGGAMVLLGGIIQMPPASAAPGAPAVNQCNPPSFPTGAGREVSCTVSVQNNISSNGARSSTTTVTACLAAAGVRPPFGCTTTVDNNPTQLVSSVNQCNGIVDGGGSNVTCNVTIQNNIPVGTTTSGVTVNECIGSGTGAAPSRPSCADPAARPEPRSPNATAQGTAAGPRCG